MRWRYVFTIIGLLAFFIAASMILPICFAIYYNDNSVGSFLRSIILTVCFAGVIYSIFRSKGLNNVSHREGIAIVSLGWIVVSLFGALPFYFVSDNFTFVDAFFESVSGFTTTGASILTNVEQCPKGLLLWRSLIQWMGGMGIIVLSIAILPLMKVSGEKLYRAEVPSPVPEKLRPKIRDTAIILWKVYFTFSVAEFILLKLVGMNFFDALCHTFTTMPTGGFSTVNFSISHFDSLAIDVVILLFMILAGINFSLHYQMFKGKSLVLWRDQECNFFFILLIVLTIIVALDLYGKVYDDIFTSFRYSIFQVVSIVTTTGFVTADYEVWPVMSQLIIMLCMFFGASAGSTSGGLKCFRLIVCFKYCYKELFSVVHPRAVSHIKIDRKPVSEKVIRSILGFLVLYLMLFILFSVLLSSMGVDMLTSFSAVAASIGNVGPGFGMVGPTNSYFLLPSCAKWLLSWCMLLGRLEIYTLLVLIVPEFWRK